MPFDENWRKSALSAMAIARLKHLVPLLPFISDLAHAIVNLYVPAKAAGQLILLSSVKPHTLFFAASPTSGSVVAAVEEPLVKYTFDEGKPIHGQREISPDDPDIAMQTFPLRLRADDEAAVAAVVTVETTEETYRTDGYKHILKTVQMLLGELRDDYDQQIYRSIGENDGVLIADKYDRIVHANLSALRIYRVLGVANPVGLMLSDRVLTRHITRSTVMSGRPNEREITAGGLILVMRDIAVEAAGQLKRRIVVIEDVTALREKEKEIRLQKDVIREIHHRVKNNLQSIASLLSLQARRMAVPEAKEALKESAGRVRSIATIHEYLSNQGADSVDAARLVQNLLNNIEMMLPQGFVLIRRFSGGTFTLAPEMTTSFALAINELLLNAIRHAFAHKPERGTIGVDVRSDENYNYIEIYDDGCGLPADFDLATTKSLGLTLIKNFIGGDLGGEFTLAPNAPRGTRATVALPKKTEI